MPVTNLPFCQSLVFSLLGFALVLALAVPAFAQLAPPGQNPGTPFMQLFGEHEAIKNQLDTLPTNAEMSAQHDMIKQAIADVETNLAEVETNLGAQIQEVKELVETGGGGGNEFPCASGTPVGTRWVVSESGRTVCDKANNKTWEQHPTSVKRNFDDSTAYCQSLGAGWEIPPLNIFESLVDTNNSDPALPTGHPFDNVQFQTTAYWSATPDPNDPNAVFALLFGNGIALEGADKANFGLVWCAR